MRLAAAVAWALLLAAPAAARAAPIHWSFEDGMDGWTVEPGAVLGDVRTSAPFMHIHSRVRVNREGRFNLSTFEGPLASIYDSSLPDNLRGMDLKNTLGPGPSPYSGSLRSPVFVPTTPTLSLALAGGKQDDDSYVALCRAADGNEVLRLRGAESEFFALEQVDVRPWLGQPLYLRVVDHGIGPWDFIALDDVRINLPALPRDVRAVRGRRGVTLTWRAVEDGVTYAVERARADGPFAPWRTTGTTKLVDGDAPGAVRYRVTAVAADGARSEPGSAFVRAPLHLRARGRTVVYRGDRLDGIEFPVGAIGSGGVRLFGDGTRNISWIFNLDGQGTSDYPDRREGTVPDSFLAIRVQRAGAAPVVRALQTVAAGPFAPVTSLTFTGEYPLASYRFADAALPVQVTEDVTSPTIPGDLASSSIPTALTTVSVRNPGRTPVTVSLLAAQQNAVGLDGRSSPRGRTHPLYTGVNANAVTDGRLLMTGCPVEAEFLVRCAGSLALSMPGHRTTGSASWTSHADLLGDFAADGALTGPQQARGVPTQTVDGALATTVTVPPGQTTRIPVDFSWRIPGVAGREFGGEGEHYATRWPDAAAIDAEVTRRRDALLGATHAFHDAIYDSTIPVYVLDRLTSQLATLRSPTVFWARNGFFGGFEGTGCCSGMPTHVWHYAQTAPRLWPEIDTKWTTQWLGNEGSDGTIPYRYTVPTYAFDGQAGVILGAYRHVRTTGATAWLKQHWPQVRGAMDHMVTANDPDGDGMLAGDQPTTLDLTQSGTGSWLGTLYLAALKASSRMATLAGDTTAAQRYDRIVAVGRVKQDAALWNGQYYDERPGPDPDAVAYGDGAAADMLLGQWWADMDDLGDLYPPARMRAALRSLYRANFREDFTGDTPFGFRWVWRRYVSPQDAGLLLFSWPRGPRPGNAPRYTDETWSSIEYSTAATMIARGLLDEGLRLVRAAADRHDGRLQTDVFGGGCGVGDGSGNPFGDDECGRWYARGMSSWSLLLALQGSTYDATRQRIAFAPRWRPEGHRSFFSAGNAWGTFAQQRRRGVQRDTLAVRSGTLTLQRVAFRAPAGWRRSEIRVAGRAAAARRDGGDLVLTAPVTLGAGQRLTVRQSR